MQLGLPAHKHGLWHLKKDHHWGAKSLGSSQEWSPGSSGVLGDGELTEVQTRVLVGMAAVTKHAGWEPEGQVKLLELHPEHRQCGSLKRRCVMSA